MTTVTKITEAQAEEMFRDMLDECYGEIEVCGIAFEPSHILEKCDPIAYRVYMSDYISSLEDEFEVVYD
jgi:hypothetical protein